MERHTILAVSMVLAMLAGGCGGATTEEPPDLGMLSIAPDMPWVCQDKPSSAGHPRLLTDASQLARFRNYVIHDATYQDMTTQLIAHGTRSDPTSTYTGCYDPYLSYPQGTLAKAAAYLHWLGVTPPEGAEPFADRAIRMLSSFPTDLSCLDVEDPMLDRTDIHASEAIVYLAVAFDFLAGSCALDEPTYAALKERLLEATRQFYDAFFVRLGYLGMVWRNNHPIKGATALGTVALLFPDAPEATTWMDQAMSTMSHYYLNYQYCGDGAFAEGPAYYEYTMVNLRAFGLALHRKLGGQDITVTQQCNVKGSPCEEEPLAVPDVLVSDAQKTLTTRWAPMLMLPSGYLANIEDADLTDYAFSFDAYLYQDPTLLWLERQKERPFGLSAMNSVELLVMYDDQLAPSPYSFTTGALGGVARLMAGTDFRQDLNAWIIGEEGDCRTNGMGHEQPDNQSIIVTRDGQLWVMDSGYIAYSSRNKVARDVNHNVVLVDGVGGPTDPMYMFGTDEDAHLTLPDTPALPHATVTLTRAGVAITRTLALLDNHTALVMDDIVPPATDTVAHTYTLLFHLNAGGSTDGLLSTAANAATLTRGDGRMDMHFSATAPLSGPETSVMTHSLIRKAEADVQETHQRLALTLTPDQAGVPLTACTSMNFTATSAAFDPGERYTARPAAGHEDERFCLAAGMDDQGVVSLYLWRSNSDGEACFIVTDGGQDKGSLCATSRVSRLVIEGGGAVTATALDQGQATWSAF